MSKRIGLYVGSLRAASFNRKLAEVLVNLLNNNYNGEFEAEIVEIGDLPLYNEEYDNEIKETPEAYTRFRQAVKSKDAHIFVTPEYNRSVPGVMKNAVDVGTRPYNDQAWTGTKAAVVSSSPGTFGGMKANYDLRDSLMFANMQILAQPETMLADVSNNFDESGEATQRTIDFLTEFTDAFTQYIRD